MAGGTFVDSSATPSQQAINARFTALKGTSPWRGQKPPPVDTAQQVSCDQCGSRFCSAGGKSAEQHLAARVEVGHAPQQDAERELVNRRRRAAYRAKAAATG